MNDFLQSLRNGQAEKPRTPKTRKNSDNSYHYSSGPRFNSYGGGGGGYQNSRNQPMKRQGPPGLPHQQGNHIQAEDSSMTLMADVLDTLTTHVETLVKNQEYMITVQERTADMLQRQADAIEHILAHLNIGPANGPTDDQTAAAKTTPAFENHYVTSQDMEVEADNVTVDELMAAEMQKEQPPPKKVQPKQTRKLVRPPQQKPEKPVLRKRRKVVRKEEPVQTSGNTELLGRDVVMGIINDMREEGATYDQVAKRLVDLGQPTFSGRGEWHAQTIHRLCSKK